MSKKDIPELKILPQDDEGYFILEGLRTSYPNIWEPGRQKGAKVDNTRTDCGLAFSVKEKKFYKKLEKLLVKIAQSESTKIKSSDDCLHPKLVKSKDGEYWLLKTSNSLDRPPTYYDADNEDVDPFKNGAKGKLRNGTYVRALVHLNASNEDGAVKIWSNMEAIQRMAKGPAFGGGGLSDDKKKKGFSKVKNKGFSNDDKPPKKSKKVKDEKPSKKSKKAKDEKPSKKSKKDKSDKGKKSKKEKSGKKSKKHKSEYSDADLDLD